LSDERLSEVGINHGIASAITADAGVRHSITVQGIARAVRNIYGAAFIDVGSEDMDVVKKSVWILGLDRVVDERYPTVVSLMALLPEDPPELGRSTVKKGR
jgi:hypothetical protein